MCGGLLFFSSFRISLLSIFNTMNTRIYLIGMMGSGKSYWAGRLAEYYAVPAIDLDALIEAEAGKTIAEIFAQDGEDAFRQLESRLLKEALPAGGFVVATGGGAPCFYDNMNFMQSNGVAVWLNPSIDELLNRLEQEAEKRPLIASAAKDGSLRQRLNQLMQQREQYYGLAHLQVTKARPEIEDFIFPINGILAVKAKG